jgi:hypothetical protein
MITSFNTRVWCEMEKFLHFQKKQIGGYARRDQEGGPERNINA